MSIPKSFEAQLLNPAETLIERIFNEEKVYSFEFRLQLLEATASKIGGYNLYQYNEMFEIIPETTYQRLTDAGENLVTILRKIPIHPSLALSALAREPVPASDQRANGIYYTDFRLAQYLINLSKSFLGSDTRVLDPACGTGILLVAALIIACGKDPIKVTNWLSKNVFACDMSSIALRGARIALSSATDDLEAVKAMWANWRVQDSLAIPANAWESISTDGFDLIVGNPPWEKIKLTRHEYLKANGTQRDYGTDYHGIDEKAYNSKRDARSDYVRMLLKRFDLLEAKEPDMYVAFIHLFNELVRPGGMVTILVPAGLIRSRGTEGLRRSLIREYNDLSITILENRARFFPIDTRFKFISLKYSKPKLEQRPRRSNIQLSHATGTKSGIAHNGSTKIRRSTLSKIRHDLTIPEVRSEEEWRLFVSISNHGIDWSDEQSAWYPHIMREVDMTSDRKNFLKSKKLAALPIIEGRMVQAYRLGAKSYVSGSGRSALWMQSPFGKSSVVPQFWIESLHLRASASNRCQEPRAGFCDIAGQTNERSMMATLIQPGMACGNKVPTILFPNDTSLERLLLWISIANSLPFDWVLRRVLTTTVNYFVLQGIRLPRLDPESHSGQQIIDFSRTLMDVDNGTLSLDWWTVAEMRAAIDLEVLIAYGLSYDDLKLILKDFPLLDRRQPPILGENSSTITRDYLLAQAANRFGIHDEELIARVDISKATGVHPYIPSEMLGSERQFEKVNSK